MRPARVGSVVLRAGVVCLTFVVAALVGVVLHLNLTAVRVLVRDQVNRLLASTFEGTVRVVAVRELGVDRVGGVEAYAYDPEGRRVAWVDEASARIDLADLLGSLVHGDSVRISITEIDAAAGEVSLDRAGEELRIARAFAVRGPAGPPAEHPALVDLRAVTLGHVWVHGDVLDGFVLDADLDGARGAFRAAGAKIAIDVESVAIEEREPRELTPVGQVAGHLRIDPELQLGFEGTASFDGHLAGFEVHARGSLDRGAVRVEADIDAPPSAVARLAPAAKLRPTVRARLDIAGALPILLGSARASAGTSEIELIGMAALPQREGAPLAAALEIQARGVDLGALREGMPRTRLGLDGFVAIVQQEPSHPVAFFALESHPGSVGSLEVPGLTALGSATPRAVHTRLDVREPGTSIQATLALDRSGPREEPRVGFSVAASVPDLRGVARIGPLAAGRADLLAHGTVLPETRHIDLSATARVWNLERAGLAVRYLTAEVRVLGRWSDPAVTAAVQGADARAGGYAWTAYRARALGRLARFGLEAEARGGPRTPSIRLMATSALQPSPRADDVSLELARAGVEVRASIGTVKINDEIVIVRRALVEGLGQPLRADLRFGRGAVDVNAQCGGLELARLVTLVGRAEDLRGYVTLAVDMSATADRADGKLDLQVAGLHVPSVGTGNVRLAGAIDGRVVRAEGEVDLLGAGRLTVAALPLRLDGPPLAPASWTRATGTIDLQGVVHLADALRRLPVEERPLSAAEGVATLQLRASRDEPTATPSVRLQIFTKELALAGRREEVTPTRPAREPWRLRDIDGAVRFSLDAGSSVATAEVRLRDRRGLLALLDVESTVPVDAIVRSPRDAVDVLADVPMVSHLVIPRRALGSLPPDLGRVPLDGQVELDATQTGTPRAPTIDAVAKGIGLRASASSPEGCDRPIDLEATLRYRNERVEMRLGANAEGRRVATARANVVFEGHAIAWQRPAGWVADAVLTLDRFPLGIARGALGRAVDGNATGQLSIEGLHRDVQLRGEVALRDLTVDRVALPETRAELTVGGGTLAARLGLAQNGGRAEVRAEAGITWGPEIWPKLDLARERSLTVSSKDLRIAFVGPLLGDAATGLDGRLSGDALIRAPGGQAAATAQGSIELRDGAISVTQIGERFHDIDAKISMPRWGSFVVERLSARARTGRLTGKAQAELAGRTLERASAEIRIAEGQSIPVAFEGVPLGQVYGTVTAQAATKDGRLDVNIDVPLLDVELPRAAGRSVQRLAPAEGIRMGFFEGGTFRPLPLGREKRRHADAGLLLRTRVSLGGPGKGEVRLRKGTTLEVVVEGRVAIEQNGDTRSSGTVRLVRGRVEIQGRVFQIERGYVTFTGPDPSNPQVVATAFWDAPDGTRVFAELTGNVEDAKLDLRSEPALSKDQIVTLIAFGTSDGGLGASTAGAGAGIAGGVITEGLNDLISGVIPAISTRIETSESGNPKPEVAIQISSRVSARLGYAVGAPTPGDSPDRASVTLDWRFYKNWSIAAEVGDHGSTSVDVVWRMRY
jgi:translocation and assembly module TamB